MPRFQDPEPSRLRHVELAYVTQPELPVEPAPAPEPAVAMPSPRPLPIEDDLIRTILEPLSPHETATKGFARKEAALVVLLDRISLDDAVALHDRLTTASAADPLATAFGRISIERRARLLAFIADAGRRDLRRNKMRQVPNRT